VSECGNGRIWSEYCCGCRSGWCCGNERVGLRLGKQSLEGDGVIFDENLTFSLERPEIRDLQLAGVTSFNGKRLLS